MTEREPARDPDIDAAAERTAGATFRQTLVRVMAVQVVTLVLLWLLQQRYSH